MTDNVNQSEWDILWAGSAWLFHGLADNLDQCVYVLDPESRCLAGNVAFARWLNRPPSELVGCGVYDLWPASLAADDVVEHERILNGERIDRQEQRPRGGQPVPVRLRKAPLPDDRGIIRAVLYLFAEIGHQPVSPSVAPALINKTILLVDPDVNLLLLATRILSPHGFYVMAARERRQAVQIYRQQHSKIDLVILEQHLPDTSGLETMNELLAINPHLRVLLMSGSGRPQSSWWEKTPGVGFVSKPYTPEQLVQAVLDVLEN